jgi:ribosomal protein L12E/L44/L45/RPP1/RPP2
MTTTEESEGIRRASLTDCETAFLHGFLIDPPPPSAAPAAAAAAAAAQEDGKHDETKQLETVHKVLDDDMLFSIPDCLVQDHSKSEDEYSKEQPARNKRGPIKNKDPKDYRFLVGLWQAYEAGVDTKQLLKMVTSKLDSEDGNEEEKEDLLSKSLPAAASLVIQPSQDTQQEEQQQDGSEADNKDEDTDAESIKSDEEVHRSTSSDDDFSWDEEECGFEHFDAWQILKDEYAADFGLDFNYTPLGSMLSMNDNDNDSDSENSAAAHTFLILGTSADDVDAHPHVLSPPLMDALQNFVPDRVSYDNWWLKYSLVRDGASMDTFKRYVRASSNSMLAIETTKGHVFGCFTSSPWRTNPSFYGRDPAFVWKMRHNRNSACHSLIEQAGLEGEIDIFLLLGKGQKVQCSTHDLIGVGEGDYSQEFDDYEDPIIDQDGNTVRANEDSEVDKSEAVELAIGTNYGFAIALSDDLLSGTTSQCSSFKNPCLTNPTSHGESFDVLNVEVWTFTPCINVDTAEKLEMTQFFVQESMRSNMSGSSSSPTSQGRGNSSQFSSDDLLDQESFYRRVGSGDANEQARDQWQYASMMDG